jgi:hypothetical protein
MMPPYIAPHEREGGNMAPTNAPKVVLALVIAFAAGVLVGNGEPVLRAQEGGGEPEGLRAVKRELAAMNEALDRLLAALDAQDVEAFKEARASFREHKGRISGIKPFQDMKIFGIPVGDWMAFVDEIDIELEFALRSAVIDKWDDAKRSVNSAKDMKHRMEQRLPAGR